MRGVWMIAVTKGAITSPCMAFTTTLGQAIPHLQQNLVLCVKTKQLKTVSLKKIFKKIFFKFAHLQMWSLDPWHRGHERVQNLGTVSPDVVFVKLVGPYPITLIQSPVE